MKNKPHRIVLYYMLRVLVFAIQLIPRRVGLGIARMAGRTAFAMLGKHRQPTLDHLSYAYGDSKSPQELKAIGRGVFENMAMTLVDLMYFPTFHREDVVNLVEKQCQEDSIEKLVAQGSGVLVITGHIGNWELLAAYYAIRAYDGAVVARRSRFERNNELLMRSRASVGVETIYRDQSPKLILGVLKRKGILGMLADQDVDSVEGIFIPFFGHEAYTPVAPAKIAIASKTPIVPAFMIRDGLKYKLYMEEPIHPNPHNSKEDEIKRITRQWSDLVERYIKRFPDQWVWMHPRWKTKKQPQEAVHA